LPFLKRLLKYEITDQILRYLSILIPQFNFMSDNNQRTIYELINVFKINKLINKLILLSTKIQP